MDPPKSKSVHEKKKRLETTPTSHTTLPTSQELSRQRLCFPAVPPSRLRPHPPVAQATLLHFQPPEGIIASAAVLKVLLLVAAGRCRCRCGATALSGAPLRRLLSHALPDGFDALHEVGDLLVDHLGVEDLEKDPDLRGVPRWSAWKDTPVKNTLENIQTASYLQVWLHCLCGVCEQHLGLHLAGQLLHGLPPLLQAHARGRRLGARADQEESGAGGLRMYRLQPDTELPRDFFGSLALLRGEEDDEDAPGHQELVKDSLGLKRAGRETLLTTKFIISKSSDQLLRLRICSDL